MLIVQGFVPILPIHRITLLCIRQNKNDNTNAYTNYTFGNRASLKGISAKSEQIVSNFEEMLDIDGNVFQI